MLAATLPGIVAAVVATLVGVAVAVVVSPVFPLGHPRVLEPEPGVAIDLVVIVPGALLSAVWTLALFALMAWLDLGRSPGIPPRAVPPRRGGIGGGATVDAAGPPPDERPGTRPRRRPHSHGGGGTALGVAGPVAVATFTASLDHLVRTPAEYGIDYDLSIEVPESKVDERLAQLGDDPDLEAVAEQRSATLPGGRAHHRGGGDGVHQGQRRSRDRRRTGAGRAR